MHWIYPLRGTNNTLPVHGRLHLAQSPSFPARDTALTTRPATSGYSCRYMARWHRRTETESTRNPHLSVSWRLHRLTQHCLATWSVVSCRASGKKLSRVAMRTARPHTHVVTARSRQLANGIAPPHDGAMRTIKRQGSAGLLGILIARGLSQHLWVRDLEPRASESPELQMCMVM